MYRDTGACAGGGAVRPQVTVVAGLRIELDHRAELDALGLAGGAGDGEVAQVERILVHGRRATLVIGKTPAKLWHAPWSQLIVWRYVDT